MTETNEPFVFNGHAIIEFMGHRKRAGKVRTADLGGTSVFVVESAQPDGQVLTETYNASSLYCLTPVSEQVVQQVARSINPTPIEAWQLPARVREAMRQIEREDREKAAAIDAGIDMSEIPDGDDDHEDVPL